MPQHTWKSIVCLVFFAACGVAVAQEGGDRPPTSKEGEFVEKVRETSKAARKSLKKLVPEKQTSSSELLDPSKALESLEKRDKQIADAVKRIKVSQPARDASDAMNRNRFEEALRLCDTSLEATPKDAYTLYLKGLCLLELGRYAEASKVFRQAWKVEPESRSSVFLGKFASLLAKCKTEVGVKEIVLALDDARAYATRKLKLKADEDDFFSAMLLPSPLLTDPILFKISAEAFAGHGPRALDQERLVQAALKIDDPIAMLTLVATLDDKYCEPLYERLDAERHEPFMDRMDVVMTYFGDDFAYADRTPELEKDVARMIEREPDEMLWKLMRIPYKKPDASGSRERSLITDEPLSEQELAILEEAVRAKTFFCLSSMESQSVRRMVQGADYPYIHSDRVSFKLKTNLLPFERHLRRRAAALVSLSLENGDTQTAMRALDAARKSRDRVIELYAADEFNVGTMMATTPVGGGDLLIARRDVPVEKRESLLQEVVTCCRRKQYLYSLNDAMRDTIGLPLTIAASAVCRLPGFMHEEWAMERAQRVANDPDKVRELREQLRGWRRNNWDIRTDTVLDAVEMRQREILPELRAFHDGKLDTMSRWALIWAAGEFKDAEQGDWLIEQLKNEDELIVRAAARALCKITGRDCGMDPDAWRKAIEEAGKRASSADLAA